MFLTVGRECWIPRCSQFRIMRETRDKRMALGLSYGREYATECSYGQCSQQRRDRVSAPFLKVLTAFLPLPPDLKLVHSSESTSIGSPGLLRKASLSLCWGWSGCYWLLGESRTYSWFSSFSPHFDLTERNESTVSLLTSMCPGRGRLTDIVPGVHIQCLTHTGSAVYVEQMHGSWRGWWLRLQCAVSVLWVSEVSDATSSLCSGF